MRPKPMSKLRASMMSTEGELRTMRWKQSR